MLTNGGLSAPEAFVLMSLPRFDASQALKLGFMGLLAQGILRMETEDRAGLIRSRHIPHLHVSPSAPASLPPIAASLVTVVRAAEPDGLIKDVVRQSAREYGKALLGFAQNLVIPALGARGLVEERRSRVLGLVPVTRYYRTPAGEAEKTRIDSLIADARSIPDYLERDPAQAAALVAALGGAILLVEGLRPHYQAIAASMRQQYPGDSSGAGWTDSGGFDGGGSFDFGNVDFGGLDFGAFDAGAFDSFDAGFSDAGGDGGGGDGGSSGC